MLFQELFKVTKILNLPLKLTDPHLQERSTGRIIRNKAVYSWRKGLGPEFRGPESKYYVVLNLESRDSPSFTSLLPYKQMGTDQVR